MCSTLPWHFLVHNQSTECKIRTRWYWFDDGHLWPYISTNLFKLFEHDSSQYIFSLPVVRQKSLSQWQIVKLHVIRIFLKLWLDIIMFQDWISGKQAKPNGDNGIENGPVFIAYFSVYWFHTSALHFYRSSVQSVLFCDKAT